MDIIYIIELIVLGLIGLFTGVLGFLQLVQIIKRGSVKRPEFSRKNMMLMLEKSFPENQYKTVLEQLERYRACLSEVVGRTAVILRKPGQEDRLLQQLNTKTDNCEPLIAQIQMSILKIAHGNMDLIKKYTEHPENYDYRDIISKAGYA